MSTALRSRAGCLAGVAVAALALRLGSLAQLQDSPLLAVPVGASAAYAAADGAAADGAGRSPLYAALVSSASPFGGAGTVRAVQAVLGAATCAAVALLGWTLAGPAVGWIAGLLAGAYGPALLYGAELTPASLTAVASLATVALLAAATGGSGRLRCAGAGLRCAGAGVAVGIAALADARALLLLPAVAAWIVGSGGRAAHLLALSTPALALTAAGGSWVRVSFQLPGPGAVVERLHLAWHGAEILPDLDPYGTGFGSWLIDLLVWDRAAAFPFAWVAPLALAGVLLRARHLASTDVLLLWFVAAAVIGALLTTPSARGRLPLAMALLPWAAVAVVDGPRRLRTTPARGLALAAIVLMAATSSAGASQARASAQVAHQTWLGYAYERLDMSAHALAAYEAAVASGAAPADAYRDLARLYRAEGQALRSVAVMQQLVRQRPGDVDALVELGDRLMGAGRALEAEEQYRLAVSNGADRRIVEGRLGDALAAQGDETGAAGAYRNLLADRPDSHRVRFQLARNLQAQGHSAEAAEQFRRLLEAPAWEIRSGLQLTEILALDESRRADTEAILGRLLEREPDLMPALWSLAILLHDAQRYEEALVPLMRLRQLDGDDPATPRLLASAYDRLGRAQEAEEAYALYRRLERRGEIHRTVGSRMREWADKVAQR